MGETHRASLSFCRRSPESERVYSLGGHVISLDRKPTVSAILASARERYSASKLKFFAGRLLLTAVLVFGSFGLFATAATALSPPVVDPAAFLFDPTKVVEIEIDLSEDAITALNDAPYEYVSATFTMVDGATVYGPWPVQVKLKGKYGSFRPLSGKSAFKLKFGNSGQRVGGLKKMTLNNIVQDGTNVHEAIGYELFRAMGVPAPRTSYAVVSVNGVDYGLHLNIETLDDVFLKKWFGPSNTTHLYEGNYGDWLGSVFDPFSAHYEVDEGNEEQRDDLAALLVASQTEGDGWLAAVDAVADLDQMIKMWAVEHYIGHWDGYAHGLTNNYYLHSNAAGEFTVLPWGIDQTSNDVNFQFGVPSGGSIWVRCVTDDRCRSRYIDALAAVNVKAMELDLGTKAVTLWNNISDEIEADNRREYSFEDSASWINSVPDFYTGRPAVLQAWLAVANAPVNTAQPFISGTAEVGQTLTADPGRWTGEPDPTFTFQWWRCEADGSACTDIGSDLSTYTLKPDDYLKVIEVSVTASNGLEPDATVASQRTVEIVGLAPLNGDSPENRPSVSGVARAGRTLTADPGAWSGVPAPTFSFQWWRCEADGSACFEVGSGESTYALSAADISKRIEVSVTASNPVGSEASTSLPTERIYPAPVSLLTTPSASTRARKATFRFSTSAPGPIFRCRFGSAALKRCGSPKTYRNLKPGRHVFKVTVTSAGLTSPPVTFRWRVR